MRKIALLLVLLLLGALPAAVNGQDDGVIFVKVRKFNIPLVYGPGTENLKQSQLFVSSDEGRSWQPYATIPPSQKLVTFSTDRDGFYWFLVQSTDLKGRLMPPSLEGAQPNLKVVVSEKEPR